MGPQVHKALGSYLKKKRQLSGLTQSDVAHKLGYSTPQFISNFERGLCSPPLKNLKTLIKLYSIPVEEIVELIVCEQEIFLKSVLTGKGKGRKAN